MKFRKKPVVVEAYQTDKEMIIHTLEGDHHASVGDWIITGVKGEQYPCKPDIFEQTYEPVEGVVYYVYTYFKKGADTREIPVLKYYKSIDEAIEAWEQAVERTINSGDYLKNVSIDREIHSFVCYDANTYETKNIRLYKKMLKS